MNLAQFQHKLEELTTQDDFESLKGFAPELKALQFREFDEFVNFSDKKYCKNLISKSPDFEIVLICWKPFQGTKHHFHPENGCLMKILAGELTETKYSGQSSTTSNHAKGAVTYIEASEAHVIKNTGAHSVSLHIYSPSGFYDANESPLLEEELNLPFQG